jgi:hypothetical protein
MLAARRGAWDAAFNALFMQLRNGATDAFYCISPQVSWLPHTVCMDGPAIVAVDVHTADAHRACYKFVYQMRLTSLQL